MSEYQVTLFGLPSVSKAGRLIRFPYRKAEAIFYYLCTEKTANRDKLISIFWGSSDESLGRRNLRQALFQIRHCLDEDVIILQGRNDLKINQHIGIRTEWDLADDEFVLCRERFLDFFYLKDCPEFEAWVEQKRESQIDRNLEHIKSKLRDSGEGRNILQTTRLIETWAYWKPWDEEMVMTGMRCYARLEKFELGIQLYQEYSRRLQQDLEEVPSHKVDLLVKTLLHRKEASLRRRAKAEKRFWGREAELQYIDERVFWFLNDENTKSIIIEGEAGIGKTALMGQIFEVDYGDRVLELYSHCYGVESEIPLRSWRDSFQQLGQLATQGTVQLSEIGLSALTTVLTGVATGTADLVQVQDGDYVNYISIENAFLSLLKELTNQWKIILYFDSLQWMDTVSRRLLQRVMIEFGNEQIFMIATCRSVGKQAIRSLLVALSERAITTSLTLSCFSESETLKIIDDILKDQQNIKIDTHEIFQRTGGHPRALTEMLNVVCQGGESENLAMPQMEMAIQFQLERLTSQQNKVLEALSVYMESADLKELILLTEMEPMTLIEILETLLAIQIIIEQPIGDDIVYKFKHPFQKDYIYQHLSLGKRRLWHCAIGEYYEQNQDDESKKYLLPIAIKHYECGGNLSKAEMLSKELEKK